MNLGTQQRPGRRSFWEWLDRWIKRWVTGRRDL
jgi:hypothetical protein